MAASLATLVLLLGQAEPRTETLANGGRLEYEIAYDEQGREQRHGAFHSWFAGGQMESEGRYLQGLRDGPWVFYHPNGQRAAAGRFADDLESGPWETWYASGQLETQGSYVRGAKKGRWTVYRPDGSKDLIASGLYELDVWRKHGRHYRGYVVDNLREGPWATYWPDGSLQLEGSFVQGQRSGRWVFHHPDGAPSSLLVSGDYERGRWSGALTDLEVPPLDPGRLEGIEPAPEGLPEDHELLAAALERMSAQRAVEPGALAVLVTQGARALPLVLAELVKLQPDSEAGRARIGFLEHEVLRPICSGHSLSPHGLAGPPDTASANELLRAWLSLWSLTREDTVFWSLIVPAPSAGDDPRGPLRNPPLLESDPRYDPTAAVPPPTPRAGAASPPGAVSAPLEFYATRSGRAKTALLRKLPRGGADAIELALAWLAAHASENGSWDGDGFSTRCGGIGKGTCSGHGQPQHDVGLTGLALLAFLGDGQTAYQGAHAERVAAGLAWLLEQQGREGLIGEPAQHEFVYGHALATLALAEALGMGMESLREPVQRACDYIVSARTPGAGWRYEVPPQGMSDTSVTGWMLAALFAASEAGIRVADGAFGEGLAWIQSVTDPASGRVGYTQVGELSSRTTDNQFFPRERAEALTAEGLFVQLLLGADPADALLRKQADLILRTPEDWDERFAIDMYAWYQSSNALQLLGGPQRDAWEERLKKSVLAHQQSQGDARGSWDPAGPWGHVGGRVYSTALMALVLESRFRLPEARKR